MGHDAPRIAVVGGRGKTGRAVLSALATRGVAAYPLGRAELTDPVAALSGASAVHLIAANLHPDEAGFIAGLLTAARSAGVPRVVYHSVAAPYEPLMPHHLAKAEAERLVRRSGLAWTILQPCAYMQNLLPPLTRMGPALEVAYDPDRPFGLVDLADVGAASAAVLLDDDHIGSTVELGGPALVSVRDVATAAGRVLGRPVPVRRLSVAQWRAGPGAALPAREREWLAAMFDYYDAYGLPSGSGGSRALLGRPPADVGTVLRRELRVT